MNLENEINTSFRLARIHSGLIAMANARKQKEKEEQKKSEEETLRKEREERTMGTGGELTLEIDL